MTGHALSLTAPILMKHAPFLLQAFAARVLASKPQATVPRSELAQQGYDVETLCDMIEEYLTLPEADRGFIVRATPTEIFLQRKANSPSPSLPPGSVPLSSPAIPGAKLVARQVTKPRPGFNPSSGRTGSR